jgi:hypothetical protein
VFVDCPVLWGTTPCPLFAGVAELFEVKLEAGRQLVLLRIIELTSRVYARTRYTPSPSQTTR